MIVLLYCIKIRCATIHSLPQPPHPYFPPHYITHRAQYLLHWHWTLASNVILRILGWENLHSNCHDPESTMNLTISKTRKIRFKVFKEYFDVCTFNMWFFGVVLDIFYLECFFKNYGKKVFVFFSLSVISLFSLVKCGMSVSVSQWWQ